MGIIKHQVQFVVKHRAGTKKILNKCELLLAL